MSDEEIILITLQNLYEIGGSGKLLYCFPEDIPQSPGHPSSLGKIIDERVEPYHSLTDKMVSSGYIRLDQRHASSVSVYEITEKGIRFLKEREDKK